MLRLGIVRHSSDMEGGGGRRSRIGLVFGNNK